MKEAPGDFAAILSKANEMATAPIAHPFGAPQAGVAQRARGIPVRQTTEVFYLPKDAERYDACCNRAWAGEVTVRYEERSFTKESEVVAIVCYFEQNMLPRIGEVAPHGDAEPEEKSRKLP
jgi:hypothetical protein